MLEYIDLNYDPGDNEIVAEYYMEPSSVSFKNAAEQLAAESSIGTWTTISTMNKEIADNLRPHVFYMDEAKKLIKVAYKTDLFEPDNIPQILSSIAGNIYGMKILNKLKLLDIQFPKAVIKAHKGPQFGVEGIRKLLKVSDRPLIGTIVKPKVGLSAKDHAEVAKQSWLGGLDVVKDDENLTSQPFNKFEDRITKTLEARDQAESETGEKKIYMPNITAETEMMLGRADYVKELGGEYIMVDILTCGWSGLQTVRKHSSQVIHAHRAMHAAFTRDPHHGISMLVLAKLARLIGVDQLHVGTALVGKMNETTDEALFIEQEVEESQVPENKVHSMLQQDWGDIKPVFAVASGGLHPASIPPLMEKMGKDIIMQFGGGCHGHPDGTLIGAKAIRQALDATMNNIPLEKSAESNPELGKALMKWGSSV